MGQNIRTLPAHAQWLAQCWGYVLRVSRISVSSHILCHAWMFPLLTPVFSHQLLKMHNSSQLGSLLLQSGWRSAVVWTWRKWREWRRSDWEATIPWIYTIFLGFYLPWVARLCSELGKPGWKCWQLDWPVLSAAYLCKATHTHSPPGIWVQITSPLALNSISHAQALEQAYGQMQIRPAGRSIW